MVALIIAILGVPSTRWRLSHSQNPALNLGDTPLLGSQTRIKETVERAVVVRPLQPRCCDVRGLLVGVPAFPRIPAHPQCRVDLSHHRPALKHFPSVERPEVNRAFAVHLQIKEPRQTGVGRCGDLPIDAEPEDGFCGWCPCLSHSEPTSLPSPLQATP